MPRRRTHRNSTEFKKIAAERVERLFELAEAEFKQHPEFSDRYVRLAWKLKTRYNVKLPSHLKRKFCRKCWSFWMPSASCRVRLQSGRVVVTCLRCGRVERLPYKPKMKNK